MAHTLLARLKDNLLLRASVATVAAFVVLGVASGALPVMCLAGAAACNADADSAPGVPATLTATDPIPAAAEPAAEVAAIAAPVGPTLTRNDVVAATFALLEVPLTAPATAPTTRKVRTTAIHLGATKPAPLTPAAPATDAAPVELVADVSNEVPDAEPLALTEPSSAPETAAQVATELSIEPTAPAHSQSAVVRGKGANVRSSPTKGTGNVLFALSGGATVTIVQSQRGWLKITDDRGRSGWVYGEYLDRG
ncbi:MAG: SH3 domain-containing protein [Devosia nanyangense]|uniref:SH3 domain-containing protein n=1 Tax=Devosia nanyangense TaxID=1228055 RepID=A0A933L0H3_9HYPH|nr:SH3 domain-containing protein [Devosia nanyangense]